MVAVQSLNQGIPESPVAADGANFMANIASPGHALPANPAMLVNNQQATTSGSSEADFDPFSQNYFDIGLPGQANQSVVLAGAGDGMLAGAGIHANAGAAANTGSTSSSTFGLNSAAAVTSGTDILPNSAPQIPPNLLLASARTATLPGAGSPSGPPQSSPTYGSGPNLKTGMIDLTAPAYVPVNADNENHSTVTLGIPAQRDFNVAPMVDATTGQQINDRELLQATLIAVGLPPGGSWSTTTYTPHGGHIALWVNQKKTANFSPAGLGTFNFYIEGTHESSVLNDVTLTFTYSVNATNYSASANMTVTPLITSFGVTPAAGQNVIFLNGKDIANGIAGEQPFNTPGAVFKAVSNENAMPGEPEFIQNVLNVENGHNGTFDNKIHRVGWVWYDGTGSLLVLKNGTYPVLDVDPNNSSPVYAGSYTSVNGIATLTSSDSPIISGPSPNTLGINVDLLMTFQLYYAWEYANYNTLNYYPLAYTHWQVNFYAGAANDPPGPPINFIVAIAGVSSDGSNSYTPSNATPAAMNPSNQTIFNGNNQWVADPLG